MDTIEEIRHANLHLLASRGSSQSDIARALNVTRQSANHWFVTPPRRNLSSENARAIEQELRLTHGCLDHPSMGEHVSQLSRFDPLILQDALRIIVTSGGEMTFANLARIHDDLSDPSKVADAQSKAKENKARGTNAEGNSGSVQNSGRTGNRQEEG